MRAGSRFAVAAVLLVACRSSPPVPPEAAVRVGEDWIQWRTFERSVAEVHGEEVIGLSDSVLSGLLDQFVEESLLDRSAAAQGWRDESAVEPPLASVLAHLVDPSSVHEQDIVRYYGLHASEFVEPERVHLRQIVVGDRTAVQAVLTRLEEGEPFEQVAKDLDVGGGLGPGGDQGVLRRDELPPDFVEPIFALDPGEISEALAAPHGYHVFQVVRRLPREKLSVDSVREDIRQQLLGEQADEALAEFLRQAQERWPVLILGPNLPFEYVGKFPREEET